MGRDDPSDKRSRGPRAFVAWCMGSLWRRVLLGLTLGALCVGWVVVSLAGSMDENTARSGLLSASALSTTIQESASSGDALALLSATSIRGEITSLSSSTESSVATTTAVKSREGNDEVDDIKSPISTGSSSALSPMMESSKAQPFPTESRDKEGGGKKSEDKPFGSMGTASQTEADSTALISSRSSENDDDGVSNTEGDAETTADIGEDDAPTSQITITTSNTAQSATGASSPLACPFYDDTPSVFPTSFWYVKNPKTASSTLGGVFRSVAAHHGVTMLNSDRVHMDVPQLEDTIAEVLAALSSSRASNPPLGLANHMPFDVAGRDLLQENKERLMLFTSVREPVSQFHSQFVQDCKSKKISRTASTDCLGPAVEERTAMAIGTEPDAQFTYVRGEAPDAQSTAAQYDFIFVRERLDESLVAFMILYSLDFDDIAHVAAKVRTDRYPGPEELPAELNELVRSKTTEDAKLWAKASALLDEKIAAIHSHCGGEAYFASMLETFRSLQEAVMKECADYRDWYGRHGFSTVLRYWADNGLAPRCRDFVVRREMRALQKRHLATALRAATAKATKELVDGKEPPSFERKEPALDGWGRPRHAPSLRGR